jgi:hypothetical protein
MSSLSSRLQRLEREAVRSAMYAPAPVATAPAITEEQFTTAFTAFMAETFAGMSSEEIAEAMEQGGWYQ